MTHVYQLRVVYPDCFIDNGWDDATDDALSAHAVYTTLEGAMKAAQDEANDMAAETNAEIGQDGVANAVPINPTRATNGLPSINSLISWRVSQR